ncbi:hypothetical protein KQH27_00855 [bacterium]|nr:hypothetical protein [bacterium]
MTSDYEKKILEKMDELIKWNKLTAKPKIRDLINQNLDDDKQYSVFELSDGILSTREIAEKLDNKVSYGTVANYWKKWFMIGLVEPSEKYTGRYRKICSLAEIGVTIPPIVKGEIEE